MADAFGRALRDYGRGALVDRPRFRRDDDEVSDLPIEPYFAPPEAWDPLSDWLVDRAGGRVLDAGCGAGRHALALRNRGHEVAAFDRSRGAVRIARERGVERTFVGDLSAPPVTGPFDAVLVVGHQLALGESVAALRTTLDRLAAVAAPGGRLLADLSDPTRASPEHEAYMADRRPADGVAYRTFRIEYDGAVSEWVSVLMLPPATLREVLADTPWTLREFSRDGADYAVHLERA